MQIQILKDILVIFSLSIIVIYLCYSRFRIPSIIGFLVTGMFVGPYGLGLIKAVHDVEILAEIGVIFLLFTIGIEFSLRNLWQIKKIAILGGILQVAYTILSTLTILKIFGYSIQQALFIGFLISLSSTAIVLKLLQEKAQIDSPHGQITLAILIFQDIIIVPMILITPFIAGNTIAFGKELIVLIIKTAGIIVATLISAKWVVPWILFQITRTRNRELFLLSILVICLAVAWITSSLGLSLALGAFLAGLIISESEYSQQAIGNILPFRDVFLSIFFVSIGMLLNIGFVLQHLGLIILIAVGILILKSIIMGASALLLGLPLRTSILVGLALSQIGEFSFILSQFGITYGLITTTTNQYFLSATILTMMVTPVIIYIAPKLAEWMIHLPLPQLLHSGLFPIPIPQKQKKHDHLIIIGFGVNGRNVTRAAKAFGIPYIIIELNPETVRTEQANQESIFYGDATQEAVLLHADIDTATVIAITVNDPIAAIRITEHVHRLNPAAHIIARTQYLYQMERLYNAGAHEVVSEEYETSIEIFTRVLTAYSVPRDDIERVITEIRTDRYEMLRSPCLDEGVCFQPVLRNQSANSIKSVGENKE